MGRVLAIILAGGGGQRLYPLTMMRSKPSVPFGGKYRIIDFTLSNCVNTGIRRIYILTQYRSGSLNQHVFEGWNISGSRLGEFIYNIPAQQKTGSDWYRGTADALRQNLDLITEKDVEYVLILSGDHVYKMNYYQLVDYHIKKKADLSVCAIRVPAEQAAGTLGVLEIDANSRMLGFEEKPLQPKTIPGSPGYALGSMGVYIFTAKVLQEVLQEAGDDFGKNIIPQMIEKNRAVFVYDFEKGNKIEDFIVQYKEGKRESVLTKRTRDSSYWRDVGTIDSYYEANMDLIGVEPDFNLYGIKWPLRTYERNSPPSKFVLGGSATESIISKGCIISAGAVRRSVLSPNVIVERGSVIEDAVIFDDVVIEPHVHIRRAIIDKDVCIESGASLGFDAEKDKQQGCTISEAGIVVVPKRHVIKSL